MVMFTMGGVQWRCLQWEGYSGDVYNGRGTVVMFTMGGVQW